MSLAADRPVMLITATPGGGKTALAVQVMKEASDNGRPLFVMGIPELSLPHSPLPPIPEWTEQRPDPDNPELLLPYFTFPPNSLIVLDEAQRVFRLRASASKVPDHVAAFETVRHTGVTFLLITQHPNFIDSHIRNLVGQHVHLRDVGLLGRWYYEWPEVADPKTFTSAPIKKKWKLPKDSFSLYKSSSLHIKRNYAIPPALAVLMFVVLAVLAGGGYMYSSLRSKITPTVAEAGSKTTAPTPDTPTPHDAPKDPAERLIEFDPVIPGRPETAPAYAALAVVKYFPVVVGCIQTASSCSCYDQQGKNARLDKSQCRSWLANPPFDPYRDPPASLDRPQTAEAAKPTPVANASPAVPVVAQPAASSQPAAVAQL